MSLINVDDDQRWVPTHVQVTVLRGRGLRAKGKHGTSDVYTIIQVGKEKFSTCVVEKTTSPEWKEECSFELLPGVLEPEGRSAYPQGSSDLVLTVMHRALIGLDAFLGQAIIPLDKVFQDRICMKNEWYKLNSKSGKKEKERGEVQVTVQFTRNNLTASMYDLSMKDKPRSTFGKLKDRMKGKKREDVESASAIVPGGFGALARRRGRLPSDGGGEEDYEDDEGGEGRRSKMRNFFLRGKLRKSSDTRSSTSLGSESSESSSRGGSLSPTAGISVVVSDLSNSPSESSNLTADNSPEHTTHPSPNLMTHKRAFSDEANQITTAPPQPRAVESLKAQSGALSQSSLCINGSHVYTAEPLAPGSAATLPATLGLLQKCSPLSRSLQNLTRRSDDPQRAVPGVEGRRWSFDKAGKEEKAAIAAALEKEGRPVQATAPMVPTVTVAEPPSEGKKPKRNLFSHGRSDSAGKGSDQAKTEQSQAPPPAEEKPKGWFGSKDSHNKPSPEVSPKVETSSDTPPSHLLAHSPDHFSCPPASAISLASLSPECHANPFTFPSAFPLMSSSNPFFNRLKCNPFFVELLADQALKSASPTPCLSSSPLWSPVASCSLSGDPSPAQDCAVVEQAEGLARRGSLPGTLGTTLKGSANPFIAGPVSVNSTEWDDSFEAFAASRLSSQKGLPPSCPPKAISDDVMSTLPLEMPMGQPLAAAKADGKSTVPKNSSPALSRRSTRIPILEGRQNDRFDWTKEPVVKKYTLQDTLLPPETDKGLMEHSKNAPILSQNTTDVGLFSEWAPKKASDGPVSLPEFASMCTLAFNTTTAGEATMLPCDKHLDTLDSGADDVRMLPKQEGVSRESVFASCTDEGAGREKEFAGNTPTVFGTEVVERTASFPDTASEASKIPMFEVEGSLKGTNPFFATIPEQKFPETHVEGLNFQGDTTLEPVQKTTTKQTSTNTNKFVDALKDSTHVPDKNLYDPLAHLFDFPSSAHLKTDTDRLLSVTSANNSEINNNNTNELASDLSPSVPEIIMNEMNSWKPNSVSTEIMENSFPAQSVDLPDKVGIPLSDSQEEAQLKSLPDVSINDVEFPAQECQSLPAYSAQLEVSLRSSPEVISVLPGTSVEADTGNILVLAEENIPEGQRTDADNTLEPKQSQISTEGREQIQQRVSVALLTETTSGSALEGLPITPDAQCSDSNLVSLVSDNEKNACQENSEEASAKLNVKEPSSKSTEDFMNSSTLFDDLKARESNPSVSPVPDVLTFEAVGNDPDSGDTSGTCTISSSEPGAERLPQKIDGNENAAPTEEAGLERASNCKMDSSTAVQDPAQSEGSCTDSGTIQPPPKPPRLFQESSSEDQHMNRSPQPGSRATAEIKPPSTPSESSAGSMEMLTMSLDPEQHQSCLQSDRSDLFGIKDGFGRETGEQHQNETLTIIEEEPSPGKEVLQSGLSASKTFTFDLEENSDRTWLTDQSYYKVKELDTSHLAVWSADEENNILTDSTHLDKALLMSTTFEGQAAVPDAKTQTNTHTGSHSPSQDFAPANIAIKLNEGLGESYLHQLKSTQPQTWTEKDESMWPPLPSTSGLSSSVSQDLVIDLTPDQLCRPKNEDELLKAPREDCQDPASFSLLSQSNPFSKFNIHSLPEETAATVNSNDLPTKASSSQADQPLVGKDPTSSLFMHDCNPQASSTPFLLAETNAQFALFPSPIPPNLPVRPTAGTDWASSTVPPSKAQPMIGTTFTVLPEETQPAASLQSSHQSSPHPVKPLTNAAPQEDKKSEGRSVLVSGLEKLKSTIHPGRAAQQGEPEADKNKALSEGAAPYYHLTHNELVSLLLQREAELEKQKAEFEKQGALLEKREAEVKKSKVLIRDLEDYIDTLLVRIMEQTPTLLQVRSKLK